MGQFSTVRALDNEECGLLFLSPPGPEYPSAASTFSKNDMLLVIDFAPDSFLANGFGFAVAGTAAAAFFANGFVVGTGFARASSLAFFAELPTPTSTCSSCSRLRFPSELGEVFLDAGAVVRSALISTSISPSAEGDSRP